MLIANYLILLYKTLLFLFIKCLFNKLSLRNIWGRKGERNFTFFIERNCVYFFKNFVKPKF